MNGARKKNKALGEQQGQSVMVIGGSQFSRHTSINHNYNTYPSMDTRTKYDLSKNWGDK